MKTIKTLLSSVLLASFAVAPVSVAFAEDSSVSVSATVQATSASSTVTVSATTTSGELRDINEQKREAMQKIEGDRREEMQKINEQHKEAIKNLKERVKGEREDVKASSTASSTEVRKERREDEMKRKMASTTEKLSTLATRLSKLGVDIKAAVAAQASSSLVITSSMTQVEARSAFKTFLLGTDYKNTGKLVSEAAKTTARINQIENQVSKMASSTDKAALVASLAELKTQEATIEQYVKDNESKFSLFGWLAKRFEK